MYVSVSNVNACEFVGLTGKTFFMEWEREDDVGESGDFTIKASFVRWKLNLFPDSNPRDWDSIYCIRIIVMNSCIFWANLLELLYIYCSLIVNVMAQSPITCFRGIYTIPDTFEGLSQNLWSPSHHVNEFTYVVVNSFEFANAISEFTWMQLEMFDCN